MKKQGGFLCFNPFLSLVQEIPLWPREIPGENDIEAQKFSWLTKLWKKRAANQIPSITYYEPKRENVSKGQTPAIIVCPGGGYGHLAPHEGEPIALWLNKLGYKAFVLRYRIYPYHHPYPLIDALRAVKLVRFRASEWSVNPKKTGMLGFSAGGHLTATVGTYYDFYHPALSPEKDEVNQKSAKPNALILCYAVISLIKYAHKGVIQ